MWVVVGWESGKGWYLLWSAALQIGEIFVRVHLRKGESWGELRIAEGRSKWSNIWGQILMFMSGVSGLQEKRNPNGTDEELGELFGVISKEEKSVNLLWTITYPSNGVSVYRYGGLWLYNTVLGEEVHTPPAFGEVQSGVPAINTQSPDAVTELYCSLSSNKYNYPAGSQPNRVHSQIDAAIRTV